MTTTERREETKYDDNIEERGNSNNKIEERGNTMMRERGERKYDDEREEIMIRERGETKYNNERERREERMTTRKRREEIQ